MRHSSSKYAVFRPGGALLLLLLYNGNRRTRRAWLFCFAILLLIMALGVIALVRGSLSSWWWRLGNNNNNKNSVDTILPPHRTSFSVPNLQVDEKSDPRCTRAMDMLVQEQIRLVALDFDLTLVDIHTGGRWRGSAAALQPHVRQEMRCLIRACHQYGIHVAIATFSTQTDLLRTVVQNAFFGSYPDDSSSSSAASVVSIPVYGGNDRVAPYWHGKQSQLFLARQYFDEIRQQKTNHGETVLLSPHEIVLVDDDERNIVIAQKDGYRTIWYDPEHSDAEDALVLTKAKLKSN